EIAQAAARLAGGEPFFGSAPQQFVTCGRFVLASLLLERLCGLAMLTRRRRLRRRARRGGRATRSEARHLATGEHQREQHAEELSLQLMESAEHDAAQLEPNAPRAQAPSRSPCREFCMSADADVAGTLYVIATPIG